MFEKLSANLNLLMEEVHISADELARRTGLPSSTIKKIRNRYNPNPTLATLLPLAQFFTVTLDQLVGNELLPSTRIKGAYQQNENTTRAVQVINWIDAIVWPEIANLSHATIFTEYEYSQLAFGLIVEEDNWENITKGTTLLVDPTLKVEHRDFIIVYKENQLIPTLKQALYDEEILYLKSMLPGNNISPSTPQHKVLGVVVEYKKHLKNPEIPSLLAEKKNEQNHKI